MDTERLDVKKCHWQVIINPNALSGKCVKYWKEIASRLQDHDIVYTVHPANHANAGAVVARSLCEQGQQYFIVIGGDGTLNEVVNGIATAGINSAEVCIVPFPVGTGNDWARTHNYPKNHLDIFPLFLKGNFLKHDIGLVESIQNGNVVDQRYFINIAGFCFDAAVINETTKGKSRLFASTTYIFSLLKVLFTYKAHKMSIITKDKTIEDSIFTIAVGIGQYNGNGMMQVPMGDPTDGLFDIVFIRKIPIFKVLANIVNLFSGKHLKLKEVTVLQTDEAWINSDFTTLGEVEGEMLTIGNYHSKCVKSGVRVLKC